MADKNNDPTIITMDQVRAAAALLGITDTTNVREIHLAYKEVRIVRLVHDAADQIVIEGDDVATETTTISVAHGLAETTGRLLRERADALRAEIDGGVQ